MEPTQSLLEIAKEINPNFMIESNDIIVIFVATNDVKSIEKMISVNPEYF